MKALIYYEPKKLGIEEVEMPKASGTDVVVKVMRAGICGSDLTAYLYDGIGVGILKKGQFGHDGQFGQERANIDAYIDCAGAAPILPEILGMAKEHSRVVIVAVYKKPTELNAANLLSAEITVKGSCGYEHSDIVEAFNNIDTHRTKTPEIVTHHFKHEDAEKAFAFAADPAAGGIKIVIDYE